MSTDLTGTIQTFTYHGRSYSIRNPGSHIGRVLAQGVPYEIKLLEDMYRDRIEGSTAVDVGAHVGNHALWLSAVCGLHVVAYEASPSNFALLQENVALDPGLDVRTHNVALGDAPGTAVMVGSDDDIIWGKSAVRYGSGDIDVRTLDSYGLDNVSMLKIDVEGNEPQVLKGAVETIMRSRPIVYTEAADMHAAVACADMMEPLGYRHAATFGATPMLKWVR